MFKSPKIAKWYEERRWRTTASEALSLYPLLAVFFAQEEHRRGLAKSICLSFFLLCDLLDALQQVARGRCSPEQLADKVILFLRGFRASFGEGPMTPKFHYIVHLPWMLQQHQIIFPCFVHERKHRELKRHAAQLRNTSCDFERCLLEEITSHHVSALEAAQFSLRARLTHCLQRPPRQILATLHAAFGVDADVKVGNHARFNEWGTLDKGDVVMLSCAGRKFAGKVWLAAEIDQALYFGVEVWSCSAAGLGSSQWRTADSTSTLVEADSVLDTLIWSELPDGLVNVVLPPWC